MHVSIIEHCGPLRRVIGRFKSAARAALSQQLLDEGLNSIKLNIDAALKDVLHFATALSAEDEARTGITDSTRP